MDEALAKEDQTGAEEARKILAQEISSLEEKAESEKDKTNRSLSIITQSSFDLELPNLENSLDMSIGQLLPIMQDSG